MELKQAIEILTEYNQWRLGEDIPMIEPSLITVALNEVIEEYNNKNINKYGKSRN